jgi:tetrahydromethanopterin S-methyltransferase subunit G
MCNTCNETKLYMKNIDKRQDKLEEKVDNIEANLNK